MKEPAITEDQTYLMGRLNVGATHPIREEDLIQFNSRYGVQAVTEKLRYMAYGPPLKPFSYLKKALRG